MREDDAAPAGPGYGPVVDLDFETALAYVRTARALGSDRGLQVSVAVVDAAGHPVLVARGSHKWHGPYMATGKARLAAAFEKPTRVLLDNWRDRPLFPASLVEVLPGPITLNPGGYPIRAAGRVVGAIGVGGGSPEQDDEIARLTVEAFPEPAARTVTTPEAHPNANGRTDLPH